ncbi:transcription antitermination factor NusB [Desulfobulbus oligotrophicus]|uniref:Transcription antitermination protein NusB n=1 Tax=Desulfobulbus oligotrophicus TaxID=1909699 RepID=A0A7T5VD52_9BACT|nr:transcription antitermination factor NusB [Desulfobulbus oligotrophicus]QQG65704.1 transcription antitermination factor NusB [Desulfobulbus oligotrophicus]
MGLRRKSRELALQFLFSHDFQKRVLAAESLASDLDFFCRSFDITQKAVPYGRQLIEGISAHLEDIDKLLAEHSHNWRIERMSSVDRNILRIAIFEMRYGPEIPVQIVINEALEVAKRYSIHESVAFINGILDAIQAAVPQ